VASDFEVEGYDFKFHVGNLKVKTSLQLFKRLAKTLFPSVVSAIEAEQRGQLVGPAIKDVVADLDCLDELLDAFVAVTKYTEPGPREGAPTELKPFVEHVFGGRPDLMLSFVAKAVQGEFGAFLKGNGPLASLMAKAGQLKVAPPSPAQAD
jgi:hypothetical protein